MDLSFMLISDYANTTGDGKLNVMGIFGSITATSFPTTHPEMFVIAQLAASPAEYNRAFKFELKLMDEDGQQIGNIITDAVVPVPETGRYIRLNHVLRLVNITFPKPGEYEFVVLIDNDVKGALPIEVNQAPSPQPEQ
jgi:hypothetical protein